MHSETPQPSWAPDSVYTRLLSFQKALSDCPHSVTYLASSISQTAPDVHEVLILLQLYTGGCGLGFLLACGCYWWVWPGVFTGLWLLLVGVAWGCY